VLAVANADADSTPRAAGNVTLRAEALLIKFRRLVFFIIVAPADAPMSPQKAGACIKTGTGRAHSDPTIFSKYIPPPILFHRYSIMKLINMR
jgi:hypothetical protein